MVRRSMFGTLLATVVLAGQAGHAQSVDTSEWVCEFCPFDTGYKADYEAGASVVSDDSAYFGDATGYDEEGAYVDAAGRGSYVTDSQRLRWSFDDLGLDSRALTFEGGQQGTYGYHFDWRQIPRRQFSTTRTVFAQSATGVLALPQSWVSAPATSGFTALDASLAPVDIESDRNTLAIGGEYLPTGRFRIGAEYRRQERDGNRIMGGAYFTQSSQLPAPFDYVTDEVDIALRYAADGGSISLSWYLSEFESALPAIRWMNPFTSLDGAGAGAIASPPDNRFTQVSLAGNYVFPQYQTVVAFSASSGQMKQNAAFLPYTTNDDILIASLPRSSADASVDTSNIALSLTSSVIDKARVRLSWRYDERDNRTPVEIYNRVVAESFVTGDLESNVPYGFERSSLRLDADYDLFDSLRLSAGYDRKTIDRDFQEVAEQTEDSGWGRLSWRPNGIFDVDVKAGAARRDIDRYDGTIAVSLEQNPLMRKYNLAYRYREYGELSVTAAPESIPVSVTLTGLVADDSYRRSVLGITDAEDLNVALDFDWTLSETATLNLNGGFERIESNQLGSQGFGAADWGAANRDRFVTWGGSLRLRQVGGSSLDFELDYTRADGTTEIELSSMGTSQSRLPDIESTLDYLRAEISWPWSERLRIGGSLRYQRFDTRDWALDGIAPDTIATVLTLGASPYDDEVLIAGIGFRYSLGGGSEPAPESQ